MFFLLPLLLLNLIRGVCAHRHVYTVHPSHLESREIFGRPGETHFHGVDARHHLIVSRRHPRNGTVGVLHDHVNKVTGVLNREALVETSVDGAAVLSDIRPWAPLNARLESWGGGVVVSMDVELPRFLVVMLEQHESVIAIHPLSNKVHTPSVLHASLGLFLPKQHRADEPVGFTWENEIVTIGDSGVDVGHCAFGGDNTGYERKFVFDGKNTEQIGSALSREPGGKFVGYIKLGMGAVASTDFEDPIEDGGHGTHVAGIVAGAGCMKRDNRIRILAIDLMKSGSEFLTLPPFFKPILEISYMAGSRVMTNSWGALSEGRRYSYLTREMDEFLLKHDDYMIFQASGNDGKAGVHSPGDFKNGITVGASLNTYPAWLEYYPYNPYVATHAEAYNEANMFEFSSRGSPGGRNKPTLVVPGGQILSAKAGGGMQLMMGTSMATPLAAWRYMLIRAQLPRNVSALVPMGIMVGSAVPLDGYRMEWMGGGVIVHGSRVTPVDRGWGLAVARAGVRGWGWYDRVELREGVKDYCFHSPQRGRAHRIVLLWRDVPSWPGTEGKLLVDYDLRVLLEGQGVLMPRDHANNVEKVEWHGGGHKEVVRVQVSVARSYYPEAYKFTMVYSGGLRPIACPSGCHNDSAPWNCGTTGKVRICTENGTWSDECYEAGPHEGEVILPTGGVNNTERVACFMSTPEFQCLSGGEWGVWPHHHQLRNRALGGYSWGLMEMATQQGELATRDMFVLAISLSVGIPLVMVASIYVIKRKARL